MAKGGEGGEELAHKVIKAVQTPSEFKFLYQDDISLQDKIALVCQVIYGADGVSYSAEALRMLNKYQDQGFGKLPVCIAKTQYSLSDNPDLKGRPRGFTVSVKKPGCLRGGFYCSSGRYGYDHAWIG